jgi:Undecaprenyl-phosphate glucose phosphotransferase
MLRRYNRLLIAFYIFSDTLLGLSAFIIAYTIRFHTGLIPITKGIPPLRQYINLLPFVAVLVPLGFHLQNLYRLRRGRSWVDDFFAVFVGTILTVVFGILVTSYVQIYIAPNERGVYEVSQAVWGLFLILNVALAFGLRQVMREVFERRWRSGVGLRRILIAGSGELGRLVADKIIEHREFGYEIVGFVDDRPGDHLGYRGLPVLGTIDDTTEIAAREQIDHLYVALPPEQHIKMIDLLDATTRECIDVKVVPDLLQVIALRARLWDLDGVPVIDVNDIPLQGLNSIVKRVLDIVISGIALLILSIPLGILALLVRITSKGPALFRQERMGLDGRAFSIVKFRSMVDNAERDSGPVWTMENDARVTALGKFLRRSNLDELPQLWNVLRGDMSIVGPRPERPHFVEQFKHRIPQYMLRHKVKAGMTGWAQVNGWRGNTALDKRIEYDLYYIENWSVRLDLKIIWLTIVKGFFHKHAY